MTAPRTGSSRSLSHPRSSLLLLSAALWSAAPSLALACWDGYSARFGAVAAVGNDDTWSAERAEKLATWLPRLDAVLDGDATLEVWWGEAELSDGRSIEFPPERYDVLFDLLADALGRDSAQRSAALAVAVRPVTVQIAATRDRHRAARLIARLTDEMSDDALVDLHGDYEAGGFPAINPAVHVVTAEDDRGVVYRVVVGAFFTRQGAEQARAELAARGMQSFVRSL